MIGDLVDWPISGDELGHLRRRLAKQVPPVPTVFELVNLIALESTENFDPNDVDPEPARCRHCDRVIVPTGAGLPGYTHELGIGSYLTRCKPAESGKPYGLVAEPKEDHDH